MSAQGAGICYMLLKQARQAVAQVAQLFGPAPGKSDSTILFKDLCNPVLQVQAYAFHANRDGARNNNNYQHQNRNDAGDAEFKCPDKFSKRRRIHASPYP